MPLGADMNAEQVPVVPGELRNGDVLIYMSGRLLVVDHLVPEAFDVDLVELHAEDAATRAARQLLHSVDRALSRDGRRLRFAATQVPGCPLDPRAVLRSSPPPVLGSRRCRGTNPRRAARATRWRRTGLHERASPRRRPSSAADVRLRSHPFDAKH